MLPCGRYYYEPEAGYKGNPWVKVSYQYVYFYLGWLLHHVDRIDQHTYRYSYWQLNKSNALVSDYLRNRKRQTLVDTKQDSYTFEQKIDSYLITFVGSLVRFPRQFTVLVLDLLDSLQKSFNEQLTNIKKK